MYFERLIAFGDGPMSGNQLEFIISEYSSRPGVRRSLFQAAVFNPAKDHIRSAQLGFPCLQHVSFIPHSNGKLTINAFYATQQLFQKAYGNFLGICRLGHFVATEMKLQLGRMNCFAGVEKLEGITQGDADLKPIITAARTLLSTEPQAKE
jgi:thymidylate synthase